MFYFYKFKNVVNPIKFLFSLVSIYKFKKSNYETNIVLDNDQSSNSKVLMEYYPLHDSIIAIGELTRILSKKYNAEVVLYKTAPHKNLIKSFLFYLLKFIPFSIRSIYQSYGANQYVQPKIYNNKGVDKFYKLIKKRIKNKNDILKIKINNIYFGDLIYDGCLRFNNTATINLENNEFDNFLKYFLNSYLFWKEYFRKNNIKAVVCSHLFYEDAILSRICIAKNIDCYQAGQSFIFKASKKFTNHIKTWFEFKNIFNSFTKKEKSLAIKKGKSFIKSNTSLQIKKIATKRKRLIKENKLKVLIAAHCLYDAPHAFGRFNFLDFDEWLNTIFNYSINTNYEWYVKLHPNCFDADIGVLNKMLKKYPNIKIIPKYKSHDDLVKEGITHVLTVYGSIGMEYVSFYNIPVIMASYQNPYKAYDFVLKSKSKKEFIKHLKNLKNINVNTNNSDIYQFLYMRFFYSFNIMSEYSLYESKRFKVNRSTYVYDFFLKNRFSKKQKNILKELELKIKKNESGLFYN